MTTIATLLWPTLIHLYLTICRRVSVWNFLTFQKFSERLEQISRNVPMEIEPCCIVLWHSISIYYIRLHCVAHYTVYRVTTHLENLEKSGNSKVVREKSGKMEKVWEKAGEVKSGVFFQAVNTLQLVFRPGLHPGPRCGSLRCSPTLPNRLGRGTPHPFPPAVTTPTVK